MSLVFGKFPNFYFQGKLERILLDVKSHFFLVRNNALLFVMEKYTPISLVRGFFMNRF